MSTANDLTYILRIQEPNKSVFVKAIGMNAVDAEVEGWYPSTEALPMWMQEKVVLLMMLVPSHPAGTYVSLTGVGDRYYKNEDNFWFYTITP